MSVFLQNDKLAVTFPALGKNDFLLEHFSGMERISDLFQFELRMLAEQRTDIPFDRVIGQPVTVRLAESTRSPRYFQGIVGKLSEGDIVYASEGRQALIRYRAVMVPAVFKLKKSRHSRIFQDTSIKAILQTVFKGFEVDLQAVNETFPPRNYCVQYEESDFAFASRLMEQEGIYYYFKHTENGHQMVFSSGKPTTAAINVDYDPSGDNTNGERIFLLNKHQELTSGAFTVWDYHFQAASSNLNATVKVGQPVKVGQVSHSFDFGGNGELEDYRHGDFAHHFDAISKQGSPNSQGLDKLHDKKSNRATLRMERALAQALTLSGQSTCPAFAGGAIVEVKNHFRGPTRLLLTEVRHQASIAGAFTSKSETPFHYSNEFQAIPADLQYRPRHKTRKPKIVGCQTAMVIAAESNDLSTDPSGRVQVQFYWDCWGKSSSTLADGNSCPGYQFWGNRRKGAASHSCWLRVSQAWAGPGFGALFTPRKGMEVVISFVDGDPDRPVIVGCAYNSLNAPLFHLPGEGAASGWKTKSLGGDESEFSGLAFVDTKGKERVHLQSQGNLIIRTEGDLIFDVGGKVLQNHNGTSRHTVGNIPGIGSGSGGGGGSGPNNDFPGQSSVLVSPASDLEVCALGSGSGGSSAKPGSFSPWKVTGAGAGWSNEIGLTWGAVMKVTVGMSGSMAVPLKYDVVVDPFTIWGFPWRGCPLLADTLTGYRKLYLSNTSEFIFGVKSEILLQKKNSNELGGYQKDAPKAALKKALEVWGIVVGTLVITEIGVMGVVADVWNTEEVSSTIVDVAAGLIVAECVTMQGKLSSACMKANRIVDVLKNTAPPVVVLSEAQKQAAADAATVTALQLRETKDLLTKSLTNPEQVKREVINGLAQLTSGSNVLFEMTDSASMLCGSGDPEASCSYVNLTPNSASMSAAFPNLTTSSLLALTSGGMQLSVGPLAGPTTATINITPTGIVISYGLFGVGPEITLNADGISISSPKVSIQALTELSITSPNTTITGNLSVTGATTLKPSVSITGSLDVMGDSSVSGTWTSKGPWVIS